MLTEIKDEIGSVGSSKRNLNYGYDVHVVQVEVHVPSKNRGSEIGSTHEEMNKTEVDEDEIEVSEEHRHSSPVASTSSRSATSGKHMRLSVESKSNESSTTSSVSCPTSPSSSSGYSTMSVVSALTNFNPGAPMHSLHSDFNCAEGDRMQYMRRMCASLEVVQEKHTTLLRRLTEPHILPTAEEMEELQMLYDSTLKIQNEISEAMEAGILNIERRKEEEKKKLEDCYYKRYGFVFIEPDTLEAAWPSTDELTDFNVDEDLNSNPFQQSLGPEAIEQELVKLKRRLNNLGKSPQIEKTPKNLVKATTILKKKQLKKGCVIT